MSAETYTPTSGGWPEFKGQIVDVFEDFLSERGYMLNNPDRDEAIKNGEYDDPEEAAIIWGEDYDIIADEVEYAFGSYDSDGGITGQVILVLAAFSNLCGRNDIILSNEELKDLSAQVRNVYNSWAAYLPDVYRLYHNI